MVAVGATADFPILLTNMKTRVLYRQLLAMTLAASGLVPLALPVLAAGTVAGTSISNTATATYEDPNAPGTTIDATSNTVVVTVAEVAGVTVTAAGITDVNGGSIGVGDVLNYDYTVTNVGNDPTRFRIPNLATVTGPGSVTGNLQVSTDGGANWTPITTPDLITGSVAPGGSILVRVPVTVAAGARLITSSMSPWVIHRVMRKTNCVTLMVAMSILLTIPMVQVGRKWMVCQSMVYVRRV